mmetsp:Transcript_41548/g.105272  ORF Transcript_41548/g.105272 Transcript_41548/m.105272 type:complete len:570 (+) Transcript_41548:245-1954(+)
MTLMMMAGLLMMAGAPALQSTVAADERNDATAALRTSRRQGQRGRTGNSEVGRMGRSSLTLVAVLLLAAAGRSTAHVCAPCECATQQKAAVGKQAALCAGQYTYWYVSGVTERAAQLAAALAGGEPPPMCAGLNASAVSLAAEEAIAAQVASAAAAAGLKADVASFESYRRHADANAFGSVMASQLREMGEEGGAASDALSDALGKVLTACFGLEPAQATPLPAGLTPPSASSQTGDGETSGPDAGALDDSSELGNVALAWGLTAMAGASTVLGAALVGVISDTNTRLIAFLNALTAGVMVQGSLTGLAAEAAVLAAESSNPTAGFWIITACFFGGAGICVLLELATHKLMAAYGSDAAAFNETVAQQAAAKKGPEEGGSTSVEEGSVSMSSMSTAKLCCHDHATVAASTRMSKQSVIVLVAGVTLHNIAEGMATFIAALANKRLGIALAVAMVLHNIPEGFAISLPWYSATGKRWQGFMWATIAGAAEIAAASVIYLVIISLGSVEIKQTLFACLFATAGGMMTFIALHELYPHAVKMSTAQCYPTAGMFLGLAIMQLALGQLGIKTS